MDIKTYSLTKKLEEVVKQYPERIALQAKTQHSYKTYTYQIFLLNSKSVAQMLINLGAKKGDRVAIILENRPEWGIIYFGILFAAAIAVPLDHQATKEDIAYFLENSGSKIVFTSEKYLPIFQNAQNLNSLEKVVVLSEYDSNKNITYPFTLNPSNNSQICDYTQLINAIDSIEETTNNQAILSDIVSIIYTSGTTGKPKGVMLTHENFYSNYLSIAKMDFLHGDHNILAILPLHHSFPFMTTLLIPLFLGMKITYPMTLRSEELLQCMRDTEVTCVVAVPQFYYLIHNNIKKTLAEQLFWLRWIFIFVLEIAFFVREKIHFNLAKILFTKIHQQFGKQLRFFVSGGAKLDTKINKFFFKLGFTILEGYGLTETSPVVAFNPLTKLKIGSVGKLIPQVEVEIVDVDLDGVGEILIRGKNVMYGYYQLPEQTKAVFRDGWFCSGDLGYIDKDGYLYVVGRKNEQIALANGKKISPEELEQYYVQSLFIKEICILTAGKGIQEKLMAVVVPNLDYFRQAEKNSVYEMIRWDLENFSKKLSPYKHIFGFILSTKDLPRTRLGKLKRYIIKEKHVAELMGSTRKVLPQTEFTDEENLKILASPIASEVLQILAKDLGLKRVNLQDYLELDLKIDSLKRLELQVLLEKKFQIKIPENSAAQIFTVMDLVAIVEDLVKADPKNNFTQKNIAKAFSWQEILNAPVTDAIIKKIDIHPTKMANTLTFLFDGFFYWILRLTCHLKITGQNNLPSNQAFILCANHNSYLDGFIVTAAVPRHVQKKLYFFGLFDLFQSPFIRNVLKLIRVIPISSVGNLLTAMQTGAYLLKNNKVLCIFPEGERSIDGTVKQFKNGIGVLLKELNLPVVPVYIHGSFESWSRNQRYPKPYPMAITFGKTFYQEELRLIGLQLGAKDDYTAITLGIREKLFDLA